MLPGVLRMVGTYRAPLQYPFSQSWSGRAGPLVLPAHRHYAPARLRVYGRCYYVPGLADHCVIIVRVCVYVRADTYAIV